jgi:hypothetical protein
MRSPRIVVNADHTTLPIRPMTCVRGSSSERAGILLRGLRRVLPPSAVPPDGSVKPACGDTRPETWSQRDRTYEWVTRLPSGDRTSHHGRS